MDRRFSVGFKRNKLLEKSRGEYVSFIDDDDDIHSNYIKMIYEELLQNPDCISLTGIITEDGQNPCLFIHSIKYKSYFKYKDIYYRPPNHLNPIKRSIASRFKFAEVNRGEDTGWAMQIVKSGLLKNEKQIKTPYYFYLFDGAKKIDEYTNKTTYN